MENNGNSSINNNDLGYIYMDLFNNENMIETQPITNINHGLASNLYFFFNFI